MKKLKSPLEYLKSSFDIFFQKDNLPFFIKVYSFLFPFAVITFVLNTYFKNSLNIADSVLSGKSGGLIWIYIVFGLVYLVVSFWVSAAGLFAVSKVVLNIKTTVKEIYLESWKRLWPFSVLLILQGLLIGLGFLVLIVPGIVAMVWFSFATFEFIVKGIGIKASLLGSKKMVEGRFWPVLGRIAVFGLFSFIVQIIISIVPYGVGSLISPFFGALLTLPYFLLYRELSG